MTASRKAHTADYVTHGRMRQNHPGPFPAECGNNRGNPEEIAWKPAEKTDKWRRGWDSNPR